MRSRSNATAAPPACSGGAAAASSVERAIGPERLTGDWWKDGYARDSWRCEEADGSGDLVLYHDRSTAAGGWYVQGWYD